MSLNTETSIDAVDDYTDVMILSEEHVDNVNNIPSTYTISLNETIRNITKIELRERRVPNSGRYIYTIPLQIGSSATTVLPGLVYSQYDGFVKLRGVVYYLSDYIDDTVDPGPLYPTQKRYAYIMPIDGVVVPAFSAATTSMTIQWAEAPVPGAGINIVYNTGVSIGVNYIRTIYPNIELRLKLDQSTAYKQQYISGINPDTFWVFTPQSLQYPMTYNILKTLKTAVTSTSLVIMWEDNNVEYFPPFAIDTTTTPLQIIYEPHYLNLRIHYKRLINTQRVK